MISFVIDRVTHTPTTYVASSSDYGKTFGDSVHTLDLPYYIKAADSTHFYALTSDYRQNNKMMVYEFDDILSPPSDSVYVGNYIRGTLTIDSKGGVYLAAFDRSYTSYFIGKDIPTGVRETPLNTAGIDVKLFVSPNPFNNATVISFTIPRQKDISIDVYDMLGRKVHEIPAMHASEGENTVPWVTDGLTSGVYIIALHFDKQVFSVKAVILK